MEYSTPAEEGSRHHGPLAFLAVPRIEIELTSCRADGNWTWRAVGAREPRGSLEAALVPDGASTGDHLRAETEQDVDGILVTAILPAKVERHTPQRLEIFGSGQTVPEVSTTFAQKGRKHRGRAPTDDNARDRRRDGRKRDQRRHSVGNRSNRDTSERRDSSKRDPREGRTRQSRKAAPKDTAPARQRRLRPKQTHRKAALANLPEEFQRLAKIVLRSGMPGLRTALKDQNTLARKSGRPEIPDDLLIHLAEQIHPALRTADWLDRAEAAASNIDEIDLRDLRAVVVASETTNRSETTRLLAEQLRLSLKRRVEREHSKWISDVTTAIEQGREVRALRLSSHPPKAGAPLPEPILVRLTEMANKGLSMEVNESRWGTLLDAVALSPVHSRVVPFGIPKDPSHELLDLVQRVSRQIPQIAILFGVKPAAAPYRRSKARRA